MLLPGCPAVEVLNPERTVRLPDFGGADDVVQRILYCQTP